MNRVRTHELRVAALGLLLALTACFESPPDPVAATLREASPPKNLLLITLDTTRADALHVYGQPRPSSPNIDRLASQGVLFEQVISSGPTTLPSHATILTGKYPYAHGARSNTAGYVVSNANTTLAEVLGGHGHRTAAEVSAPVIGRHTQINQGFDEWRDMVSFDIERNHVAWPTEDGSRSLTLDERAGGDVTRHGLKFLQSVGEEPFFLWLHYFDPHVLRVPPELFLHQLPDSGYLAEVLYVDHQIGRVTAELARLGRVEDTLVVITADHGEGLDQHGEATHSYFVYDSTIRVPMIFWGAALLPQGLRVPAPVRTVDIMPTVLDLMGHAAPAAVQGTSLRPLLDGSAEDLGLLAYGESLDAHLGFGTSILRFVREGDWKYIHKVNPELFNVSYDPQEQENLAKENPEIVERLRGRLRELLAAAPPPPSDALAPVSDEIAAQLVALGYVGAAVAPRIENELATYEVSGTDPSTLKDRIRRVSQGYGALKTENYDLALELFQEAYEDYSDSLPILASLVETLHRLDRDPETVPLLRHAIEIAPEMTLFHRLLARALLTQGESDESEQLLRIALGIQPCEIQTRADLAGLMANQGRRGEQLALLAEGARECPDSAPARNEYAYALATIPDPELRDGVRALAIIQEVLASVAEEHPAYLDTLAAAYAETGSFEPALTAARRAVAVARAHELPKEALEDHRRNLATLKAGRPIRQP